MREVFIVKRDELARKIDLGKLVVEIHLSVNFSWLRRDAFLLVSWE